MNNRIIRLGDEGFNATTIMELSEEVMCRYTKEGFSPRIHMMESAVLVHLCEDYVGLGKEELEYINSTLCQSPLEITLPLVRSFLKKHPYNSDAYYLMGLILIFEVDVQLGIDALIQSLKLNPHNINALLATGDAFYKRFNDVDTALSYFHKARTVAPEDCNPLNMIAKVAFDQGDYDRAIELYSQSCNMESANDHSFAGLANVYYTLGNYDEAFNAARQGSLLSVHKTESPENGISAFPLMLQSAVENPKTRKYDELYDQFKAKTQAKTGLEIKEETEGSVYGRVLPCCQVRDGKESYVLRYNTEYPLMHHKLVQNLMCLEMEAEIKCLDQSPCVPYVPTFDVNDYWYACSIVEYLQSSISDLFVEQRFFDENPELRQSQFTALCPDEINKLKRMEEIEQLGLHTEEGLNVIRTLKLLNSIHIEKLYGINIWRTKEWSLPEKIAATNLYSTFSRYQSSDFAKALYGKDGFIKYVVEYLGIEKNIGVYSEYEILASYFDLAIYELHFLDSSAIEQIAFQAKNQLNDGIAKNQLYNGFDSIPGCEYIDGYKLMVYCYAACRFCHDEYHKSFPSRFAKAWEDAKERYIANIQVGMMCAFESDPTL